MATSQQPLVCDNSTLTNFKQWAKAISDWFTTAGWTKSSDTGMVDWTSIASVPGTGAYVYEIWKPGDALTVFYVKVEYGNYTGSSNSPSLRFTIGTSTSGAGAITGGAVIGPVYTAFSTFTPPSTSLQYECDFSGSSNRIGALMWRDGTNSCQQIFAIERSLDSSGAATGAYVTIVVGGKPGGSDWPVYQQQSLVFGVGATPVYAKNASSNVTYPNLAIRRISLNASTAFNNGIPFDTVAPMIGYFDYNMTMIGAAATQDITEGVTFTVTLYGATRTYMPTKNGDLRQIWSATSVTYGAICLRYD